MLIIKNNFNRILLDRQRFQCGFEIIENLNRIKDHIH